MRILLASHHFMPSVGGIETVSRLLLREFLNAGHDVRVVTFTTGQAGEGCPVLRLSKEGRGKSMRELLNWTRWCDVFFQNQIGLQTLGPWFFTRKPLVIATHAWLTRDASASSWLKRGCLRLSRRAYASRALQLQVGLSGTVIYNPYEEVVFHRPEREARDGDLIFVGRLVSDKGVEVLLQALRSVVEEGLPTRLTVVGSGPEEGELCKLTRELGLEERVVFVGELSGERLAAELQRHRILVVPSVWNEPFGLVAVEAIACGCVVVGSEGGGLPEAIGPCGETFPNGDARVLAASLLALLTQPKRLEKFRVAAPAHLARFRPVVSATKYLDLFASCSAE